MNLPGSREPDAVDQASPAVIQVLALAALLSRELRPGDVLTTVAIQAFSGSQVVQYSMSAYSDQISRSVFNGDLGALERAADVLKEVFVDATPGNPGEAL